ncbi:FAD-binding oxidoreductase [Hydrogenophaga sp. PAMC20947]|uniref:FAD-binding oxidoreductase n=1 Tax=Hydrogenophaga sp. PAMC20947 TaxID=2565558 RepID=UPI00109DE8FB|nr:FAD-binding oxidoreductase [Hydrogenophaga sp. PAMC20947]QCB45844.1 FAD-binding oxidoreductase [Hydrogenophaga sp. PAMC20947]
MLTKLTGALRTALGCAHVRSGADVQAMDVGWHPDNLGAGLVALPANTAEVAEVVRLCREHGVAIVPQGGRTGLVGGSISHVGEVIVSLARMSHIECLDAVSRIAVVQGGVTLESLQGAAAAEGLEPGIDIPSRGSATIAGMVSTNAGGIMAFRNGVMRHRVLGLEAVLADGSVYSDLTRVVKNSAGYDLKHLFIGAEGSLGLVTRVVLKLDPLPQASATALLGLPSVQAALETIRWAMSIETGHLRAAEAMWQRFIQLTAKAQHWSEPGMALDQPIFLLMSLGGAHEQPLRDAFETLFGQVLEHYPDATGIIASSARQERDLWRLREDTDALYRVHPAAPSYDVSVPLSSLADYLDKVLAGLARIDSALQPYVFGHLADGNLHIILSRAGALAPDMAARVESVLYGTLQALGGSFSAEHGVGSKRIGAMFDTLDPGKLATMKTIKNMLDPDRLMNPGKVLPAS